MRRINIFILTKNRTQHSELANITFVAFSKKLQNKDLLCNKIFKLWYIAITVKIYILAYNSSNYLFFTFWVLFFSKLKYQFFFYYNLLCIYFCIMFYLLYFVKILFLILIALTKCKTQLIFCHYVQVLGPSFLQNATVHCP